MSIKRGYCGVERWNIWRKAKDNMDNKDSMEQTNISKAADDLENAVNRLTTAILESEEYLAYRAELDKVLQVPGLKAQIDEFRKRNYELQSSADIDFDKLDRFEKEYEDFRSDPLVSDFLAAELAFCRRMQGIETRVTAELDFQ